MSHTEKPDKAQRIPTWDGEPSKFDEFKQRVRLHVLGTRQNERALITARIAGSLTGKAWQIVEDLPEERKEEMLCTGTCDLLLEFLKESLMDSAVPEAGRFVREYLYKFRRAKSESMKLYVQRHRTLLGKLEKSMRLVEQNKAGFWQNLKPKLTPEAEESEDSITESDAEETPPAPETKPKEDADWKDVFPGAKDDEKSQKSSKSQKSASSAGWTWSKSQGGWKKKEKKYSDKEWEDWRAKEKSSKAPKSQKEKLELVLENLGRKVGICTELEELCALLDYNWRQDLLPATFTGWLLLQRSGLAPTERAVILSASKGLDLPSIENALNTQWSETELKERDLKTRSAFGVDGDSGDETTHAPASTIGSDDLAENDVEFCEEDFMIESDISDEEDQSAYLSALAMAAEGRTMVRKGQRSLTTARAIVRDLRSNRRFFK